GDRLSREGAAGDALHGGAQAAQVLVERAVAVGHGIEGVEVLAQILEALRDQAVVLHLVAAELGEGHLDVDFRRGRQPEAGKLARLELALQRRLEQRHDRDVALGFRFERLVLAELGEQLMHLRDEAGAEVFAFHDSLLAILSISQVTVRTIFPNCSLRVRASCAARASASGKVRSTTGRSRPSSTWRSSVLSSPRLPMVEPRIDRLLKNTARRLTVASPFAVAPQSTMRPPQASAFRLRSKTSPPTWSTTTSAPRPPVAALVARTKSDPTYLTVWVAPSSRAR